MTLSIARLSIVPLLAYAAATAAAAAPATLSERIERLLAASPAASGATWGIQVMHLGTGKPVYELNPNRFFVPASNTKLFSTSLALIRLGPNFTFRTRVLADAEPDAAGCLPGDLRLIGGGDPNLSARAIGELAGQVAAHGVKCIEGGVIGDDTWYIWEPYGSGWSIDDPQFEYGAAVSALTVNDNTLTITVHSGSHEGEMAALTLGPAIEYYQIDNRIRTVAIGGDRKIHVQRAAGGQTVQLWGTIPLGGRGEDVLLGIEDPAHYAALAMRQALEDRGITVGGGASARHLYPNEVPDLRQPFSSGQLPGVELASHTSAPLIEDLRITAKTSQNLHAELALRAVGKERRGIGSREAGLDELQAFLSGIGIAPDGYNLNDGSGLARLNLVTPATVVTLLRHMYASKARENWMSMLPVGGRDGTLSGRFVEKAAIGRIHAKTGSLSHVTALSGYAERRRGDWVAFSILVNNFNGPAAEVRGVMDRICNLLLE